MILAIRNTLCTNTENVLDQDVRELKRQWQLFDDHERPQCLWIACSDLLLDRPVKRIMALEPALMLRRSANRLAAYATLQCDQVSAIDFAVDSLGVSEIIICGHSVCNGIRDAAPVPLPAFMLNGAGANSSYEILLKGNQRRQTLAKQAKQNVVQQLANLATYPSVIAAMQREQLRVHGLFYLCESGGFLRYDVATDEFGLIADLPRSPV